MNLTWKAKSPGIAGGYGISSKNSKTFVGPSTFEDENGGIVTINQAFAHVRHEDICIFTLKNKDILFEMRVVPTRYSLENQIVTSKNRCVRYNPPQTI